MKARSLALIAVGGALLGWSDARAWNGHQSLQPYVMAELAPEIQQVVMERRAPPCHDEDARMYRSLSAELGLNAAFNPPPTAASACANGLKVSGYEILLGAAVDEPDWGMDQNLDPMSGSPVDPRDDRPFMGGYQGKTSQGFRHMYFGGWSLSHPIATFQIPMRSLGQSPERIQALATKARALIAQPETRLWGFRVLGWAMHYVQDLAQPFHAAQLPSLRMVPWKALEKWPPKKAFQALVAETTRVISNYHWAYEAFVPFEMQKGESSRYAECLSRPADRATINKDIGTQAEYPRALGHDIAEESVSLAPEVGSAMLAVFGGRLKEAGVNLVLNQSTPDYASILMDPELREARSQLHEPTCTALANAVYGSKALLRWATKR